MIEFHGYIYAYSFTQKTVTVSAYTAPRDRIYGQ